MTPRDKKRFARLWKKEYDATVKSQNLNTRLDMAQTLGNPTARIRTSIESANKTRDKAVNDIEQMVCQGIAPSNAVNLCKEELGNLCGYAADCFHDIYHECKEDA